MSDTEKIARSFADLDALPPTSLVRDEHGVVAFCLGGNPNTWTMGGYEYTTAELLDDWLTLPAALKYDPATK